MTDVLKAVWAKQVRGDKPYFFISTKRKKDRKWKDHFFRWPNFSDLEDLLERHSTDDYDLYFCPLPFSRPYRRKEYVTGSHFLWADIDEAQPDKMKVKPSVLWESSPGRWAGLWYLERWLDTNDCEKYNQRMTYGTGSDKAGWDLTQVLRVPGTRNHKYKGSPLGKLVRVELNKKVKLSDVPEDVARSAAGRALEIYKKWESKLRGETRATLTARVASEGKRSEVLWKLYHQMFDAGMSLDEIKIVVRESVWNKWRGRRSEESQLDRDIEKCLKGKLQRSEEDGKRDGAALAGAEEIYEGLSAADVKVEEVRWLWWPYISFGHMTIVEGDPGLGKSYMMQMVASAVCDGGKLPSEAGLNGQERIKTGRVLYLSVEDDASTVIVPRLQWNGCRNLGNMRIYDRKLTMDEEGLRSAEYLVEKFKVNLVVFDTLNYFIGGIDAHRANEVAQQMEHFQRLASKYKVAVVVLRHLTKSSAGNVKAAYRGQGSIQFAGSAREVLTVGIHPEDHNLRIVAVTKLNIEAIPKALGYRIEKTKNGGSRFKWDERLFDLTSDDIVDVRPKGKAKMSDAEKFLREELSDGAVESSEIEAKAEKKGISLMTLRRVKREIGVLSLKRGFNPTRWFYELPEDAQ